MEQPQGRGVHKNTTPSVAHLSGVTHGHVLRRKRMNVEDKIWRDCFEQVTAPSFLPKEGEGFASVQLLTFIKVVWENQILKNVFLNRKSKEYAGCCFWRESKAGERGNKFVITVKRRWTGRTKRKGVTREGGQGVKTRDIIIALKLDEKEEKICLFPLQVCDPGVHGEDC